MATKEAFPKELFVRYDGEGADRFLNPSASIEAHAEVGESVSVAVYALVRIAKVTTKVEAK